jgi:D-alanyl-lipoteichoic acid acyltransferase DltB (MBOAT superfamily)
MPHRFRWAWLLGASSLFYMAFVPIYVLILYFTIVVDYIIGIEIEKAQGKKRKYLLYVSVAANMGVLAIFKYYNFFIDNFNALFSAIGFEVHLPVMNILLPLGLSFHTFQALSYTIEIYRGHQKAERHLGIYALYVMFFPQLVAGPIERPQNMLHQYHEKKEFNPPMIWSGLRLMLWGYFKKTVVADRLAGFVDPVFQNYAEMNSLYVFLAALAFVIQIYGDFSGYSDIAIGSAKVLGIQLMINFERPLLSQNITEFWRRWHISLSTWFKDYIFQPLAVLWRNAGLHGVAAALLVTFIASGMWHGAGWNFIIYGFLYGSILCIELYSKNYRKKIRKKINHMLYKTGSIVLTFLIVAFVQIFFRATDLSHALHYISALFSGWQLPMVPYVNSGALAFGIYSALISLLAIAFMFWIENKFDTTFTQLDALYRTDLVFASVVLFIIATHGVFNQKTFIYFQF